MKKNVASQSIGAEMVNATTGAAFTGAVSVAVTIDNGTQGAGGGTAPAHEGNGYHSYTPTQAETNGDHVAFTFTGTGAIPATVQVYTQFPQTGDNFARLGAPAGASVSADIADLPTVAEFEARTLAAAAYFDPAADTVVNVTNVATLTGHTAQTGDSFALANGVNGFVATKADTAAILVDTADMQPKLGAPAGVSVSADIAAVKVDTAATLVDTAEIGAAGAGLTALATAAALATTDAVADAIKVQTDKLTFTVANKVDSNVKSVNDVTVTGTGALGSEWGP